MKYACTAVIFMAMALIMAQCESSTTESQTNRCTNNIDCPTGQYCYKATGQTKGICRQIVVCDCDPQTETCINSQCVPLYPDCTSIDQCHPCQTCDTVVGKCIGEPFTCQDGDATDEEKGEDENADGDVNDEDDVADPNDDTPDQVDIREEDVIPTCTKDSDCAPNQICDNTRHCVANCTVQACETDEGTCNPTNGHCECCSPHCGADQLCNYNVNSWYCSNPCEPVCPDGYVCSGGSCVELRCPSCPTGYRCGADTCYICKRSGDYDADTHALPANNGACLPANAPCIEGISDCCSGACVMGHCM